MEHTKFNQYFLKFNFHYL